MPDLRFTWEEETHDRRVIRGAGGRLTFARQGDRWTHHLACGGYLTEAGNYVLPDLISAVETDPERGDPACVVSPVYQEIHRHELAGDPAGGLCVLLTGHLHQHHFSAAVRLFHDRGDHSYGVLEIDVADRCRSPVSSLAATYLVRLGSSALADANPQRITWRESTEPELELDLHCDPPSVLGLAEAGRTGTRVQAVAAIAPGVFTHRLRYRWRWRWHS
jgi:hypothetical protein